MSRYSYSKLSTFEQCPLRYKYKYIDKLKPNIPGTIESHLGSVVHKTLEWIYKNKTPPTINEIVHYYIENWEKNYKKEFIIVKKEFNAKDYFNKGLEFLLNYYKKYFPFKDGTIRCEEKVTIEIEGKKKYKIIGFIDRLVYNTKTGEYEIHDYKTANLIPSKEKIKKNKQLALYSIAIKEKFGKEKDVVLIWHYLSYNLEVKEKKTNEDLKKLKKEVVDLIEKIESTKEFKPKKSSLCRWCEYKDICPFYNDEK